LTYAEDQNGEFKRRNQEMDPAVDCIMKFPGLDRTDRKIMNRKPRVLIGKVGLDGHDVGARVVARALADAGMEVIYTGLRQSPQQITHAALEEAVDAIGISILSGAHMALLAAVRQAMKQSDLDDLPLVVGGIIPKEDVPGLKALGVWEVFPPETPTPKIVEYFKKLVQPS